MRLPHERLVRGGFNEDQRRANDNICACVSRAIGGTLTVDTAYRPR
jgi:hypothetical protein